VTDDTTEAGFGDGHLVSPQWSAWREAVDLDEYDMRFAGQAAHGEADLIASFAPATVLDAGCGTGRVAIELDKRGFLVHGVDLDPDLLERARRRCRGVTWHAADLAEFDLGRTFDVVAMPGNVLLFCRSEQRFAVVQRCAAHVAEGGVLIVGFSIADGVGSDTLRVHDAACSASGLALEHRWATWDRAPFADGSYVVSVHRRDRVASL
jgi:SAM-dependent methyltransferase